MNLDCCRQTKRDGTTFMFRIFDVSCVSQRMSTHMFIGRVVPLSCIGLCMCRRGHMSMHRFVLLILVGSCTILNLTVALTAQQFENVMNEDEARRQQEAKPFGPLGSLGSLGSLASLASLASHYQPCPPLAALPAIASHRQPCRPCQPWQPWQPLPTLAALGSPWKPLAALGSSWQPLAALGSPWQPLAALAL